MLQEQQQGYQLPLMPRIAGLLFVVEEVYHHFSRHVWVTALTASLVANAVSSTDLWSGTGSCYDRKITRISFERLLDSYCLGDFSRCAWIRL